MKKIISTLCAMLMLACAAGAQGWFRQPTPNDTLRSTVVLPDKSVVFQIYAPKAEKVAVTGDLPWDKPVPNQALCPKKAMVILFHHGFFNKLIISGLDFCMDALTDVV